MLDLAVALWLGFLGACFGSFLNVVAYRMPRGMSVVWKPSHCPKCGHAIRAWHNVPIFGWLMLRGRCRDCGQSISPRYAIVEAAMGTAFFILAYAELFSGSANMPGPVAAMTGALNTVVYPNWPLIGLYAYHGALLCLLMSFALIDQDGQRIPRRLIALALIVVAVSSYQWWDLYPERTRNIRVKEWKAPFDAFCGAMWGASPWIVAAGVQTLRHRPAAVPALIRLAISFSVAGGFLGLQPIVRVALLWLPGAIAVRFIRQRGGSFGYVAPVWLAALLQILFWKPLASLVSW